MSKFLRSEEYNPIPLPDELKKPDLRLVPNDETERPLDYDKTSFKILLRSEIFNKLSEWAKGGSFSKEATMDDIKNAIEKLKTDIDAITGTTHIEKIDLERTPELSVIVDTYQKALRRFKALESDSKKTEKESVRPLYAIGDELQKWVSGQTVPNLQTESEVQDALVGLKEMIELRAKADLEKINPETLQKVHPDLAQAIDYSLRIYRKANQKLEKEGVPPPLPFKIEAEPQIPPIPEETELPPPIPQFKNIPREPIQINRLTDEELNIGKTPETTEKNNINIDSVINALLSFGENSQYQPTDNELVNLVFLPKEQAKQALEEVMNKFNEQQRNLPQESRFKKVLSFFRGKNESQKREEAFLNGFAKLQTTIFKSEPEAIHKAVGRGVASRDRIGDMKDEYGFEKNK